MSLPSPLLLHVSDANGSRELRFLAKMVTAGNDPDCDLWLNDAEISQEHGHFEPREDGWYYCDGSEHGSVLNGVRLTAGKPVLLHTGDQLQLGSISISVGDSNGPRSPEATDPLQDPTDGTLIAPARRAEPAALPAQSLLSQFLAHHRGAPDEIELFVSVGRAVDNDFVLSDPYVSGHHLEAWLADGQLIVHDLASRNGTFLDDRPFSEGIVPASATLRLGMQATLPASELIQRLLAGPQPSTFVQKQDELDHLLVGQGLGRVVSHGKVILRDVDISVRVGQLVAIAGASGAGKSTLMNLLNGYTRPSTGHVEIALAGEAQPAIGYVPQEDIINRELPVRDAIVLSAMLRYPPGTPRSLVEHRAESVMSDLGLADHTATVVGRLSGGQRKRASVALELMQQPRLLLLDEPTSGLDPASDRRLIRLLRALAESGIGVVLITHTAANIDACDTVAFLAAGGYLVYWGTPEGARHYFQSEDLEQVYEALDGEGTPVQWRQRFLGSEQYLQLRRDGALGLEQLDAARRVAGSGRPHHIPGTGRWQLRGLTIRYYRTLLGDRRNLALLLLQVPIILILTRIIFVHDVLLRSARPPVLGSPDEIARLSAGSSFIAGNPGPGMNLLFVLATTLVWLGTINAAREICKELPIWDRERHVGVRTVPYLLSKVLVLGGLCLVQTLLLLTLMLVFWAVPGGSRAWSGILVTGFLAALSGVAVGLGISASASTPDRAVAIVPLVMIPQILFGGAIIPLSTIGTAGKAISTVVGARWAFETLGRFTNRASYLPLGHPLLDAVTGSALGPALALLALCLTFMLVAGILMRVRT